MSHPHKEKPVRVLGMAQATPGTLSVCKWNSSASTQSLSVPLSWGAWGATQKVPLGERGMKEKSCSHLLGLSQGQQMSWDLSLQGPVGPGLNQHLFAHLSPRLSSGCCLHRQQEGPEQRGLAGVSPQLSACSV